MNIAELERTLKSGDYACDICSFRGLYGFVIYRETNAVREFVSWDFGYYGKELAESAALARILRRASGVSVKDYSTVFDDSAADCDSCDSSAC